MRVVLDTNVIVSAALKANSWPAIVLRWVAENGVLLKSKETEREVLEVLGRPRFISKVSRAFVIDLQQLFAAAEDIEIVERVMECRDLKDDKFLELGINGHASVIVTGDVDLLSFIEFRGIAIMSPAVFGRSNIL